MSDTFNQQAPDAAPTETPATQDSTAPAQQDWRAALPDEVRRGVAKFTSPEAVAKSYVELERQLGGRVKVPGADAEEKDWARFYDRVGGPTGPEGYEIQVPEGEAADEAFLAKAKDWFHQAGLTPRQAQSLAEAYQAYGKEAQEAAAKEQQRQTEIQVSELKREWGADYEANLDYAQRTFADFMPEGSEALTLSDGTKLGNHPDVVRAFAEVGRLLNEDSLLRGQPAQGRVDAAFARLRELEQHPKYWTEEVQQEVRKLYKSIYGDKKQRLTVTTGGAPIR